MLALLLGLGLRRSAECDTWLIINYDRSHYTIRDTSFHSLMRNKTTFEHIETLATTKYHILSSKNDYLISSWLRSIYQAALIKTY